MITKQNPITTNHLNKSDVIIDIETTGFHRDYCHIYLIGLLAYDHSLKTYGITQFFASSKNEEEELLKQLTTFLQPESNLISYNGRQFDLPFIQARIKKHQLTPFVYHDHFDLYHYLLEHRWVTNRKPPGMKILEREHDLVRTGLQDGSEATKKYQEYMKSFDGSIKSQLLDYNREDLLMLEKLLFLRDEIEHKKTIHGLPFENSSSIRIQNFKITKDQLSIHLTSQEAMAPLLYHDPDFNVKIKDHLILVESHTITGQISPSKKGTCIVTNPNRLEMDSPPNPPLKKGLILIKEEEQTNLPNLMAFIRYCLTQSFKSYG